MENRIIKFRGRRLDNNEWIYGCLIYSPSRQGGDHYRIFVPANDIDEENKEHLVDFGTIGQYTGLKDSEGVEIYENDIVHDNGSNYKFIIVFKSGCFCGRNIDTKCEYTLFDYFSFGISDGIHLTCKIIGNIHQNPELINPPPQ